MHHFHILEVYDQCGAGTWYFSFFVFSSYVLLCRKLERLESRRQELEAVGNKIAPGSKLDAQNQAGKSMTDGDVGKSQETEEEQVLAMKLEEAEKIIRRLRRENEENRREVSVCDISNSAE